MTRVAVVGVGSMGRNHVRVYSELPDVELVAISDANQALAESVSKLYHVPYFTNYCEMIERMKPDAVSVVVPSGLHYQIAKDMLKFGCHTFIEKPIANTVEEAEDLIAIARSYDRKLMVGHIERWNPAILELKRRLENGELGRIFQVHTRRLSPFPTRIQDVDVIMDLAPHDLDIMRFLLGREVKRVHAESDRILHDTMDDLFAGFLRFDNNVLGLLEINWLTPTKIRELNITGEFGLFQVNYLTQDLYFFENAEVNGESWSTLSLIRGVSEGMVVKYPIKKKEPLKVELENFVALVEGRNPSCENGLDAKIAIDLVTSLKESIRSGHPVEFEKAVYV